MGLARATSVNRSRKDAVSRATRVEPSRKPNRLWSNRGLDLSFEFTDAGVPDGIAIP